MAKGKHWSGTGDGPSDDDGDPTVPPAPRSAPSMSTWDGATLRAARERSGVSIEEMSGRTKINIAILKALEEERFEDAPKARVYVRGFVRCIAEEIGVDPEAVAKSYVPRWERWYAQHSTEL